MEFENKIGRIYDRLFSKAKPFSAFSKLWLGLNITIVNLKMLKIHFMYQAVRIEATTLYAAWHFFIICINDVIKEIICDTTVSF